MPQKKQRKIELSQKYVMVVSDLTARQHGKFINLQKECITNVEICRIAT